MIVLYSKQFRSVSTNHYHRWGKLEFKKLTYLRFKIDSLMINRKSRSRIPKRNNSSDNFADLICP